jgi:uncharacterized protein with GYD domain
VKALIFVSLGKLKRKPEKAVAGEATERVEEFKKRGIKILNWYWTLGRYDTVVVFEAANEKEALKFAMSVAEFVSTETLIAVPRQEAIEML